MSNSLKQGNKFRDDVAALLRTACRVHVDTEKRVGAKKVDLYFEHRTLGATRRIAVECKDHARPLTKEYIKREIFADYQPLLEANLLDDVLVVAPLPLNADANTYIEQARLFSFMTFMELQNSLMDFTQYLVGIEAQYREEGLNEYYVRPQYGDNQDLEEKIIAWLSGESSIPIAILAGYGMGKTSFARHIAHKLATDNITTQGGRIPILIKLGEIATEQGLEGLVSKVLAAHSAVGNYHFDTFMELNRRGRFLVILDGFDEMKHTMSWSQFVFNFEQLNRLVVTNARVLLLGRPSAFLSDAEQYLVLKGMKRYGERAVKEPGWHEYEEITLSTFSEERANEFIERYISYVEQDAAKRQGREVNRRFVESRLLEIKKPDYAELISRPVQAKMLTDIAADPSAELRAFSRYELYHIFITRLIEREQNKQARHYFDNEKRRTFIREIAWWLWVGSGLSGFTSDSIPVEIISPFSVDGDDDVSGLKRDLLSGSILDMKASDNFYFPHRSFQEFFVAEYIVSRQWNASELGVVSSALNPEIVKFIKEQGTLDVIASWYDVLDDVFGTLSMGFLGLIAWGLAETGVATGPEADRTEEPWALLVKFLALFEKEEDERDVIAAANFVLRSFNRLETQATKLMCMLCLLLAKEAAKGEAREKLAVYIASMVLNEALDNLEKVVRHDKSSGKSTVTVSKGEFFTDIVLGAFSSPKGRDVVLNVDLSALYELVESNLSSKWKIADLKESLSLGGEQVPISALGEVSASLAMTKKGGIVARFFAEYPDPKVLVKVQKRRAVGSRLPDWARS